MTTVGQSAPKYAPGKNPNSLANLKPPWQKGTSANPGKPHTGPMITPALRRMASLDMGAFFRQDLYRLTMAEAVAAAILTLAIQEEGGRERQMVADRLDGGVQRNVDVELNPGTGWLTLQEKLRELG